MSLHGSVVVPVVRAAALDFADPAHQPVLAECLDALAAGEPRRALRSIEGSPLPPRVLAALGAWAFQLDGNWYPGDVGAEAPYLPPGSFAGPQPGTPLEELLELVADTGPSGLHTSRSLLEASVRAGAEPAVREIITAAQARLGTFAQWAENQGLHRLSGWAAVALGDLVQRSGLTDLPASMAEVRPHIVDDPALVALSYILEGDWLAAPGSSPEALGFDLSPYAVPNPLAVPDPVAASAAYSQAETYLPDGTEHGLQAALALRRAVLSRLTGGDGRRDHLERARAHYAEDADAAASQLLALHTMLADIDDGALGRHTLDLGGGWHVPEHGPVADLLGWATTVGSQTWGVGIGQLLARCGTRFAEASDRPRARTTYLAALPLTRLNPRIPSATLVTALAASDTRVNLATAALLRLEREFGPLFNATDGTDPLLFTQKSEAAFVMLNALNTRARGPAAAIAADRMTELAAQIRTAVALMAPTLPDFDGPTITNVQELHDAVVSMASGATLTGQADAAAQAQLVMRHSQFALMRDSIVQFEVLGHLASARAAQAGGVLSEATRFFDLALEKAGAPSAAAYLAPLVLVTARRLEAARAALASAEAASALPDEMLLPLALAAEDQEIASRALARLDAAGAAGTDWQSLLSRSELALNGDDPATAITTVAAAIETFEESISLLLRDPDRLDACDQPDVAALFTTLARGKAVLGDAEGGFAAAEHLRGLVDARASLTDAAGSTGDAMSDLDLVWQHAAAEYAAASQQALAHIGADTPDEVAQAYEELDTADAALADIERQVEAAAPGILMRRGLPAAPIEVAEVQARLPADTLLLEYLCVGSDLLAWAVTRETVEYHEERIHLAEIAELVRRYRVDCAAGYGGQTELTTLLIEPFAQVIRTHERILVSAFGPLTAVPFHALPFAGQPLGLDHVVSYLPSAAELASDGVDRPLQHKAPLIVGDPAFDAARRPGLARLAGAALEAQLVADTLGVATTGVLIGDAATEPEVTARLSDSDLVHLSTHGHLDELSPFTSSLVLAGQDDLTVADLTGLRTRIDLAVLTGCDTGRGTATLGGELIGLARSLLRSGVRRTIVSLWPVDDIVVPILMRDFYTHIRDGMAPATALATAQRTLHTMTAADLRSTYQGLGGDPTDSVGRRGLDLDPELRDDAEDPAELGGDAERYWAPFILIG